MPTKSPDGLPYPFRQASWDYGTRRVPAQGIVFHMAEGCDVAGYLEQRPGEQPRAPRILRGVSATFAIQADGEVIQMLDLDHVSGSLNPRDVRSSNSADGFWGRRFTRYYDPDVMTGMANHRTISVEMAGEASSPWSCGGDHFPAGINPAQVASAIQLVKRLRQKYKRPIGVNGHADFADYKPCPGKGAGIKALLAAVGHGREDQPAPPPEPNPCQGCQDALEAAKAKLDVAEDLIAAEALRAGRVADHLKGYVPTNEA